jgi:hypothetical protein
MGFMRRQFNILLIFLLLAAPAAAQEPLAPLNFKARYTLAFAGVPFGGLAVDLAQDSNHYAMTTDVVSTGLAALFARHKSHTTASGSGENFAYPNRSYATQSQTRKKKRNIAMRYENGRIVSEEVVPPDNRETRKAVADALRNSGYDPLLIVLELRKRLQAGEQSFALNLYDGRRLTRANITVLGKKAIRLDGKKRPVVAALLKRELVEGFTTGELARYDPNEPPLTLYFSDDAQFIPLKLSIPFTFGSVSATLEKQCSAQESCLLK